MADCPFRAALCGPSMCRFEWVAARMQHLGTLAEIAGAGPHKAVDGIAPLD